MSRTNLESLYIVKLCDDSIELYKHRYKPLEVTLQQVKEMFNEHFSNDVELLAKMQEDTYVYYEYIKSFGLQLWPELQGV